MALQNGHPEAISAYIEGIKQLGDIIEAEVIKELLAGKKEDGVPGLFMARHNGHRKAVRAYVDGIGINQLRDIMEPEFIRGLPEPSDRYFLCEIL